MGGWDSGATNPMNVKGSFVTSKPSVTLSSAAVEVASQMKVGFGPGLAVGNILGYGDVIVAIGQRTGTLVAGLPCSAFYLTVSGHAYMEAQVAVWRVLPSRWSCSRRATPIQSGVLSRSRTSSQVWRSARPESDLELDAGVGETGGSSRS